MKKNNFYKEAHRVWVENFGDIPEGMELHHKLPRIIGGRNNLDNLELLTREEHIEKHRLLCEQHNNPYLKAWVREYNKKHNDDLYDGSLYKRTKNKLLGPYRDQWVIEEI